MAKYEDLCGKKFNRLTVITRSTEKLHKEPAWICQCDCGNTKLATRHQLTHGSVKSCGCLNKVTTESFIETATKLHAGRYDYSKVVYAGAQAHVSIICPIHGEFKQRACIHTTGSGCQECSALKTRTARLLSKESFTELAIDKYGSKFDYTKMVYERMDTEAEFVCPSHGVFLLTPTRFIAAKEPCAKCRGNMTSKEGFVRKATKIHGNKYDYSLVDYIKSKKKVKILCKAHGVFEQTPHNHTAGKHGCPTCGMCGFNFSKDASLYVLICDDITKIGITNRSAKDRVLAINNSSGLRFNVLKEYAGIPGKLAYQVEQKMLEKLSEEYSKISYKFEGSTECFLGVDTDALISNVEEILAYE